MIFEPDPLAKRSLLRAHFSFEVPDVRSDDQVSEVRRIASQALHGWQVPDETAEDAVLVVSELVTNGLKHGPGPVRLRCTVNGTLTVEATDGNPAPATLRVVGPDDTSGRGLLLVKVLSDQWGVSDDGTTTWCVFDLPCREAS